MKLVSAKCPNCGGKLELSKSDEQVKCKYCDQTILVDDAIACYKLKISGNISVEGLQSNSELISTANELLDMNEYLKAKRKFLEFSEKCPDNYQGWIGLLVCRTRNFTVKDNNIMFENDINRYYEHFLRTAPEEIKNQYVDVIETYLHPAEEKAKETIKEIQEYLKEKKPKNKIKIEKKFIAPIIFLCLGLAMVVSKLCIGGFFWIATGIILLPQFKEKFDLSSIKSIIIASLLGFIGFVAVAVESPYSFQGDWKSDEMNVLIEKSNIIITLKDCTVIEGPFTNSYNNSMYLITVATDNRNYPLFEFEFNDSTDRLCLYENESCTFYFQKVE